MAGVAENIQVSTSDKSVAVFDAEPTDLTFDLTGDTSLQELIDSELALRISREAEVAPEEPEVTRVHPVTLLLEPSRGMIEAERAHTMATLNVFSDTIDLSPSEPTSPLFPRTPIDTSPVDPFKSDSGENPFKSDSVENPFKSDSPVEIDSSITEDASDLEPIPLFTQTITSDHESPLTEANPFLEVVELPEDTAVEDPEVLVVVDPPDSPGSFEVESPSSLDKSFIAEETQIFVSQEVAEEQLLDFSESESKPFPEFTLNVDSPKPSESETPTTPLSPVDVDVKQTDSPIELESDSVDCARVGVANSMCSESVANLAEDEWTTVEDAVKEVQSCEAVEEFEPQPPDQHTEDIPPLHNNVSESISTTTTTKTVKKKKSVENGDTTTTKTKKTKKTKKSEEKENHISVITNGHHENGLDHESPKSPGIPAESPVSPAPVDDDELSNVCVRDLKSSFSKFDQLQKKSVLHVRSSDASKIQKQLNQETPEAQGANPTCKACNKTVFVMEQIKAERSVWHKNCFRCKECSKQLTVDIYQSHEGELYCKPHFKELFKPKAVLDNSDEEPSSDKADLGLEELSALNVKSRFQVFEKTTESSEVERSPSTVSVKRSQSILSKLAKFQKKGMDVGVTDESLNGVDYEESSSSEDEAQGEDGQVIKGSKLPEKPISFNKMEDVKRTWESSSGSQKTKEELRAEHKKEISQIRSRLFQGKQGKMKEMYEQAVAESEGKVTSKKDPDIVASEKARLLKERFERGEIIHSDSEEDEEKKAKNKEVEDMSVFEAGISKKSRSIFLELDATAAKTQTSPLSPPVHALTPRTTERRTSQTVSRQVSEDIVRASDSTEDVVVPTADISNKFKFFETYKPPEKERKSFRITPPREGQVKEESPDREVYRDPNVVRSEDAQEDETIVKRSQTASRMLSLFRQMEEKKEDLPDGPKPLKCFTPPPDYKEEEGSASSEEEEEESEEEAESGDDGIVRASDKIEDEFLKQAQNAARAKALKEKFEHWEPEKQSVNNAINMLESEQESIESTKSLRARFESLKAEADQPKEKPRPKVNRFVAQLQETPSANKCVACDKTAYPLEKIEVDGKVYHANCFRCQQCHCKLRMETYTLNNDNLYCLPHFRQLFISKGNYDEGFGSNQHKRKWESQATTVKSPAASLIMCDNDTISMVNGH